ncbi:MAG: hypothetical protein R3F24_01470 [Gammaproteobacteria bacterium]
MRKEASLQKDGDAAFERTAAELLQASVSELDAATLSRLNQARQAAMAQHPENRTRPGQFSSPWTGFWSGSAWSRPALAVTVVSIVAAALWLGAVPRSTSLPPVTAFASPVVTGSDMDFLLTDTSLEMIEDLDFYAWLDADRSDAELRAELESVGSTGA